jgi:hypothetical protein
MEDDNNYISFLYDKVGCVIDYIKTFFYKNDILYIDNQLYNNKIDDIEIDNLINEMKEEIKFDKEFLVLEHRYKKLVKEIEEIEEQKNIEKEIEDKDEDEEDDNNNNHPYSGELIAIAL